MDHMTELNLVFNFLFVYSQATKSVGKTTTTKDHRVATDHTGFYRNRRWTQKVVSATYLFTYLMEYMFDIQGIIT